MGSVFKKAHDFATLATLRHALFKTTGSRNAQEKREEERERGRLSGSPLTLYPKDDDWCLKYWQHQARGAANWFVFADWREWPSLPLCIHLARYAEPSGVK
jgi:hypothetical protein